MESGNNDEMQRYIISTLALGLSLSIAGFQTPSANAQEMYDSSVPAHNSVIKKSPSVITIKFMEGIYFKEVRLVSTEPEKKEWPLNWKKTEKNVFSISLKVPKPLPPGRYEIQWSADVRQHYHPDGGVIIFTIKP